MTGSVTFFVPGAPAPQGSKRHVGNGVMVESSKAVGPWRERVALAAHQAMRAMGWPPHVGAVTVALAFLMPRPKSLPKTRTVEATKRPDIDKLVRACFDAMTDVCFTDDSQVVGMRASKRYALPDESPGVQITVTEGP
ncbi:MAG: RusA family crossover junction endodeoxyribonuclease [Dehalococcoidia bacterium]|nr:RusA family crossover junction endodeoxyribonuclease [Dehalococcoidia bacterium]